MVSSVLVDALNNPTRSLQELYEPDGQLDSFPARVSAHFSEIFRSMDAFREIPVLSVSNPPESYKDRALVRFRAMIQDTSSSPQMYLAKRSGGRCGGWGLDETQPSDDDRRESINYADLRECTVVWAVSVPGESAWVGADIDGPNEDNGRSKRTPTPLGLHSHKFPTPDMPHVGVQVKVYNNPRGVLLKSTDIINLVGILTSEPLNVDLENPDAPLVPTLHVLFSQNLPPTLVPRVYPFPASPATVNNVRDDLITWIADEALAGDRDAAEWVLLCLIGRTQSRTPPILPPTLTLSLFPPPPAAFPATSRPTLAALLSHLFPTVCTLPLSLGLLNSTPFAPESKNEDLHSGWLQLPQGSVCVVTESGVSEGSVSDRGVKNLRAVQEMMTAQTLDYVFPFSRFTFQTDVAFLVLTEGKKSAFFQTNINVPLRTVDAAVGALYKPAEDIKLPSPETLDMFRNLVGGAKIGHVIVGEDTAEYIQDDFVKERKAAATPAEAVTSDDLIHRMTLARLLALSLHASSITVETWEKTKLLVHSRKVRISNDGEKMPV